MRQAQEEFDRTFPGFRTEPLTLVIRSENGQPVTDQQIAEIRNEAMTVSGSSSRTTIRPTCGRNARTWTARRRIRRSGSSRTGWSIATTPERSTSCGRSPPRIGRIGGRHTRLEQDSIHSLFGKLPLMVVLLITTTTILMFLAFGSLVLPIKAALMSALTLGSTMGVLTWMFVDGHFSPAQLHAAAADGPMIG